jgi:hypothetical protein
MADQTKHTDDSSAHASSTHTDKNTQDKASHAHASSTHTDKDAQDKASHAHASSTHTDKDAQDKASHAHASSTHTDKNTQDKASHASSVPSVDQIEKKMDTIADDLTHKIEESISPELTSKGKHIVDSFDHIIDQIE